MAKWRQKGELLLQFGLKRAVGEEKVQNSKMEFFFRESVQLLSRIPGCRIVGFLRAKKKSGSTQRELLVGTSFGEFRQTP